VPGDGMCCVPCAVDLVKTRLMNQAGAQQNAQTVAQYRGMSHALVSIVSKEGLATLYTGFVPILTRKVLWCSAFFMTYEQLRAP
jgi:hypothetical protein